MRNPFKLLRPRRAKSTRLSPDGLPITEFPPAVSSLLRLYGLAGTHAAIYATQPNVRTVVDTVAREAAELNLKMYLKDPRGENLPSARIEVDHRMIELLDEPSPGVSSYRFWYSLFADIAIYDRAIWRKVRVGGRLPKALLRIPPALLLPVADPVTGVIRYWRATDGSTIPTEDLVVFWGYDPSVNEGSIAPMETLRRLLAEEAAAGADREGMWRNSARKDGVIEQHIEAVKMSDEARESFLLDVEDSLAGAGNSGRPLLLEPGQSWKDAQWSPRELEYIKGRVLNRVEVAAAFHMPPAMVAANINGQEPGEDTLNYFYTSTLPPFLTRVESEIQAQLLPEFEASPKTRRTYYVEFNLDSKLRGSFEKQASIMATTAGGPVITVNEGRARLNLPPIPGGDFIYIPMNSLRGGGPQGSPQAPVETPAIGNEPVGTTPGGGTVVNPDAAAAYLDPDVKSVEDVLAKSDDLERRRKQREDHEAFLRSTRPKFDARGKELMMKTFSRQRNIAKAGKVLSKDRWDRELADDLFGFYYQAVGVFGGDTSERIGEEFDHERTANFLREHAALVAADINDATRRRVESSKRKADADEDGNPDGSEYDDEATFGEDRAGALGTDVAGYAMGWGILEAGRQSSQRLVKTWLTTSRAPRQSHSDISGSSAEWDEEFGNGLLHPSDPSMGPEEGANCACIMTVESVSG